MATIIIHVRVTATERAVLAERAVREGTTMSGLLRKGAGLAARKRGRPRGLSPYAIHIRRPYEGRPYCGAPPGPGGSIDADDVDGHPSPATFCQRCLRRFNADAA